MSTKMPPQPLTQCVPPDLDWSRPGTPAATDFGDIYFSVDGGLEESRTVFLSACGLPEAWDSTAHYTIGELGFGTGLNFLATWQMWDAHLSKGQLDFISVEKFPFSKDDLANALRHFPELKAYADRLLDLWPGRVKGFHRIELSPSVTLTLIHDDILPALSELDAVIDAWFLDGFSPAKNPDMWSADVMAALANNSRIGTKLATFTVAGSVRAALSGAGFLVSKKEGFGRKRHRLEAVFNTESDKASPFAPPPEPAPELSPAPALRPTALPKYPLIIGGGISGASVARAFLRAGVTPTLIEASEGLERAASANAAALIKPRLDLQDRPEARFFLSSYLFARQAYLTTKHVLTEGLTHLSKDEKEQARFEKIVAQAPLGAPHLGIFEDGLTLPSSLIIAPRDVVEAWTDGVTRVTAHVDSIERFGDTVQLYNKSNDIIAEGDALIICAGTGVADFKINGLEDLRYSRGQLSWGTIDPPLESPVTYGGYAIPLKAHTLIGATHARLGTEDPYKTTSLDDVENFEKFECATGHKVSPSHLPSRASIRVTTPGTLPRVKEIDRHIWVMTGLGSRGFVFAPLIGTHIVSKILGRASPLSKRVSEKFSFGNTS